MILARLASLFLLLHARDPDLSAVASLEYAGESLLLLHEDDTAAEVVKGELQLVVAEAFFLEPRVGTIKVNTARTKGARSSISFPTLGYAASQGVAAAFITLLPSMILSAARARKLSVKRSSGRR